MKKFGKFGLIMATMVVPLFTSVQEDLPNFDELCEQIEQDNKMGNEMLKFASSQSVYKIKMRDIIIDMDRLGYF